jgi:RNA polymerase-binding transcription factor DksA
MEKAREEIANKQRECAHDHAVIDADYVGEHMNADGYCERCGAEITKEKELAF